MESAMSFTYETDIEEHVLAGLTAAKFHPAERKARRMLMFVFPGIAAALWIIHQFLGDWGTITAIGNLVFPFAILWFPLFTLFGLPFIARRQLRTAARSDPSLRGPVTRSLGDEALILEGADGSLARIPWSTVAAVLDHPRFWIFMLPPNGATYIPKRATGVEVDERIRSWLPGRVGSGVTTVP